MTKNIPSRPPPKCGRSTVEIPFDVEKTLVVFGSKPKSGHDRGVPYRGVVRMEAMSYAIIEGSASRSEKLLEMRSKSWKRIRVRVAEIPNLLKELK
jgi:hypothetical protein